MFMKNKFKSIAVTGGIGSGKSYALQVLKGAGYFTVSCDGVYADLFETREFLLELKKLFPDVVIGDEQMKADRKKLSDIVFNDAVARQKLNELSHPMIIKECFNRAEKSGKNLAFIEVPLLFEGAYQDLFDGIMVITRDKEERIASVIARSNLTRDEIENRMRAQFDYDTLDKNQYIVIENDGDFSKKVLETAKKF